VGLASVRGREGSGWASGEGVEEHAEDEREQALRDPFERARRAFCEVVLESHLSFEVREHRLDREPDAGQALLIGEVGCGTNPVGGADR
jgi:hypothetical protein